MAAGTIVADNRGNRDDVDDADHDYDGANYSWVWLEWQHGLPNDSRHEGIACDVYLLHFYWYVDII